MSPQFFPQELNTNFVAYIDFLGIVVRLWIRRIRKIRLHIFKKTMHYYIRLRPLKNV